MTTFTTAARARRRLLPTTVLVLLASLTMPLCAADAPETPAAPPMVVPAQVAVAKLDLSKKLPGLILDNDDAELTGEWTESTHVSPFLGANYLHDENKNKGERAAKFTFDVPKTGRYALRVSYTLGATRAANVPVELTRGDKAVTLYVDQRRFPKPELAPFAELGVFDLKPGKETSVVITNGETTGHVIVDAVWLEPTDAAATPDDRLALKPLTAEEIAATAIKKVDKPKALAKTDKPKPDDKAPVKTPDPAPGEPFVWLTKPTPKLKKLNADGLDALIEQRLAGWTLAEQAGDEQFLRRAVLDLCGRPPKPEEYEMFAKDTSAEKRAAAVDRYLAHDDFGRNWANYWSDTFSARLQQPELTFLTYKPFKQWLTKELNEGTSWDEITKKILTAEGKVVDNPAATLIGYHQGNPIPLAGETTRIFLGAARLRNVTIIRSSRGSRSSSTKRPRSSSARKSKCRRTAAWKR
ncbi:MAG: DUF1549 domain-containing protein [Pirellulales bacterium]